MAEDIADGTTFIFPLLVKQGHTAGEAFLLPFNQHVEQRSAFGETGSPSYVE